MPCNLNPPQAKAVLALDSRARSTHCLGQIGDCEELWGARNDEGWLIRCAPDDGQYFPIWPHPEYARITLGDLFPEHTAERITLDDFMSEWLPRFRDEGVKIGIFPNVEWTMWLMEAEDVIVSLNDEIAQYE